MRIIVVRQPTDLEELRARLIRASSGKAGEAGFEQVKAMNPHLDFQRIKAGTVLLVPDLPAIDAEDGRSIGGEALEAFAAALAGGLKDAGERVRAGLEALKTDRAAVQAAVRKAAVKRAIEADPLLKQQLEDAEAQFAEDQKEALESAKAIPIQARTAAEEVAALAKLLG